MVLLKRVLKVVMVQTFQHFLMHAFQKKYFELDFDRQSAYGSSKTALVQFWFGQTGLDIINIERLQNKESSIYIYEAKSSFFI